MLCISKWEGFRFLPNLYHKAGHNGHKSSIFGTYHTGQFSHTQIYEPKAFYLLPQSTQTSMVFSLGGSSQWHRFHMTQVLAVLRLEGAMIILMDWRLRVLLCCSQGQTLTVLWVCLFCGIICTAWRTSQPPIHQHFHPDNKMGTQLILPNKYFQHDNCTGLLLLVNSYINIYFSLVLYQSVKNTMLPNYPMNYFTWSLTKKSSLRYNRDLGTEYSSSILHLD